MQKPTKQTYQVPESDDEDNLQIIPNSAAEASESIAATLDQIVSQLAMVRPTFCGNINADCSVARL
jgi:hypothetical protein